MAAPRILVVEDDASILLGLQVNLEAEGYSVLSASRGDTGVEEALREHPDLVVLDIMLPGMNGLDVCQKLRRKGFEAPIIMLTARAEEVDRVVGLEIGADDYVTKPFGIRELLARGANDCEAVVRTLHPEVDAALEWLSRQGAARMTGTGAAVFAPFVDEHSARRARERLPGGWLGIVTRGVNQSPLGLAK